ncbi:MFS transporter [Natrialba asiatica]|uniref:Major facilitator superfamily protein n=1 Tax=Natrialba asiatica (strain ATCC 700177 / DSM 12278 / JCM 9576 / FERM P-10747 / NBRC 102637 / 172P1) TaxID=29540 RepID=M0AHP8_NATA1|nr:MFS transporter [Natrialba asiatica]ELY98059.1 major facilitator superfamily protein [Natrialba asiatica DSM 12278]
MRRWRYSETVLALSTLAFFATMVGRLAISPVLPMIKDEFGVSNTVVGIAMTGMWMAYFLSQFPSGIFADRYGERPIILIAVGGTAATSLFLAVAPVFDVFVLGTVALGAVAGLHYSVATTLLTRTYDEIGAAIGIHNSGGPAAGLIAPPIAGWVGVTYGWRPAVAIAVPIAILVYVLFARFIEPTDPRRPDQPMRNRFDLGAMIDLLSRPQVAFPICLAIAAAFVWQATSSFLPTFLEHHRNYSTELASVVFAGYFVVQATTQVGVGAISDRYGRDFATAGCMLLASAGFALLVVGPGFTAVAVAVLLIGTGLGWGAALLPRFMDVLSDAERGAGFGLIRTVYGFVGALGSVGTGLVADLFNWGVAFGMLAGLLALVLCALVVNWALSLGY